MNIANLLRRSARDHADRVALRQDDDELSYPTPPACQSLGSRRSSTACPSPTTS